MSSTLARHRLLVLANPAAAGGHAAGRIPQVLRTLREHGAQVRQVQAGSAPEAQAALLAAVDDDVEALVTIGGDGTHAIGVQVAASTGTPLAVVPTGTGNDLPRALGVDPHDPVAAARVALTAPVAHADVLAVGRAGDEQRLIATVATAGFDSLVVDRANTLQRPSGRARYLVAVAAEYARLRAREMRLVLDGATVADGPAILAAMGNTGWYGGGMHVCPRADPFDGLLDVTLVHDVPRPRLELPGVVARMYRGTHLEHPAIEALRGRELELHCDDMNVYGDGELAGTAPLTLRVRPAALPVVTPGQPDSR